MLAFPPDFSFVIQIVSFFILWMGLKRLLFDPVLRVLEERESRTAGARKAAAEMTLAAELSAADYQRRMDAVRVTLSVEAQGARAATESEERKVLSAARDQASKQLAQLRDNLGQQTQAARSTLGTEARDLATQMLDRIVGRRLA